MLRADVAAAPDDLARRLTVVRFLQEMRGSDAARAELDRLVADASKATERLGWKPAHSLDEGLRATVDWIRARGRERAAEAYAL